MSTDSKEWFKTGSQVGKVNPELLKREHESFKKRLAGSIRLGKQNGASLASSKQELDRQIADVQGHPAPTGADASQELDAATKVQDAYHQERQAGAKKAASGAQQRLTDFAKFAGAYGNLLEAVSSAGGPYGEVGFQTLSILLIVFVNKTKNDTRLVEHLTKIRKCLPRLEVWQQIYPNNVIRELVATAYLQVIEFSRSAAEYFSWFWHRVYLAVNPIATIDFEDIATDLYQTLAEINAEATLRLHDNAQAIRHTVSALKEEAMQAKLDMKQLLLKNEEAAKVRQRLVDQNEEADRARQRLLMQNEDLKRQVDELNREANRRDRQADMERMKGFQKLLKTEINFTWADVSAVKQTLMDVFPNDLHFSPLVPYTGYLQLNKTIFQENMQYRKWLDHEQSSLFFLSGSTAYEGRKLKGCTHCWLSPAAIYIAEDLLSQGSRVAFISCHPDLESETITGAGVLSSLISQVLQWRPQILRDKEADFRRILETRGGTWTQESLLVDLLDALLSEMQDLGSVYFVIDRLDCCGIHMGELTNELARLVKIKHEPGFRVKVAVVAETSGGTGDWHPEFLPRHLFDMDRLFVVQHWDQRRLTPSETSVGRKPSIWSSPSAQTL